MYVDLPIHLRDVGGEDVAMKSNPGEGVRDVQQQILTGMHEIVERATG